jgi:hypothetical protein
MNIIDNINHKTQALVNLGLTDENKVRRALTTALMKNPNRNPQVILQQQYALMELKFYGGDTRYVKGE